eukprot:6078462-Amphidinium_carterae.1
MSLGIAPRHYVYIDNLGLIGFQRFGVSQVADSCKKVFEQRRLELHDESNTTTEVDALGVSLSAEHGCVRVSTKKFFKVWNAIGQLLRKGTATGLQLQMLVGHMTFLGLIERSCLSILHAVYAFVLKNGEQKVRLWPSVIDELRAFRSVMVLLSADWKREWSSTVLASDASEYGWGVCSATWAPAQVARVGRILERSRYKKAVSGYGPRELALRDPLGLEHLESCTRDEHFPPVPCHLLQEDSWRVARWGGWGTRHRQEHIGELECRALLCAVQHAVYASEGQPRRILHLVDNLGVGLCMERGRAHSFRYLCLIRRIRGLMLAGGFDLRLRWIPSEQNPADRPSRYLQHSCPDQVVSCEGRDEASESAEQADRGGDCRVGQTSQEKSRMHGGVDKHCRHELWPPPGRSSTYLHRLNRHFRRRRVENQAQESRG